MGLRFDEICIDAANPTALGQWWSRALGWPHKSPADVAAAWQRIRAKVRDWNDLEPELIGRVEELIDFVTESAA